MIRRLKNLWAWSNIHPYESQAAMPSKKHARPAFTERDYTQPILTSKDFEVADIIYPDTRKDVLRAKKDPTLDDILTS